MHTIFHGIFFTGLLLNFVVAVKSYCRKLSGDENEQRYSVRERSGHGRKRAEHTGRRMDCRRSFRPEDRRTEPEKSQ